MSTTEPNPTILDRLAVERDDLDNAAEQARIDGRFLLASWCDRLVFELSLLFDGRNIDRDEILARFNTIRVALDALHPADKDMPEVPAVVNTTVNVMMMLLEAA